MKTPRSATPTTPGRSPKPRVFKQSRAAATYRALLNASAKVFARRGFDGTLAAEISSVAGVSIGTFYGYFNDKREAFIEILREHLDETLREVLAKLSPERFIGADPRDSVDIVLDVLLARSARMVDFDRVYLGLSLRDRDIERMRAEFEKVGIDAIEASIRHLIPPGVVANPRAAAIVVGVAAFEVAGERAGLRPRVSPTVSDQDVKHELREMLCRYLFPDAAPGAANTSRAAEASGRRKPAAPRRKK